MGWLNINGNWIGRNRGSGSLLTYWKLFPNSDPEWVYKMLVSYLSINSHITYTNDQKLLIYQRLAEDYVITTFGPGGANKSVCDFFLFFENSNTTTNIIVGSATTTKTGDTLRWNYGDTNTYDQNDLPDQINNGVITVTSTDGFAGVTVFTIYYCTMSGGLFDVAYYMPNLTNLTVGGNAFTGVIPPLPTTLTNINLIDNDFTSGIPNLTTYTNLTSIEIYSNARLSGSLISTNASSKIKVINANTTQISHVSLVSFDKGMTNLNISSCEIPSDDLDDLLTSLNTYFTANAPTANCTISMQNFFNGFVTNGLSNSDYTSLKAIWVTATKTLTCTFNYAGAFNKGKVAFTFDDVPLSIHTLGLPLFTSKGIVGTVYQTNALIDDHSVTFGENICGWEELIDFQDAGWTVGSHGNTHTQFADLDEAGIIAEATASIAGFVAGGLIEPQHFCYPFGNNDALSKTVLSRYFKSARIVSDDYAVGVRSDPFLLSVVCIDSEILNRPPTFEEIKKYIDYANTYKVGVTFLSHQIVDGEITTDYQVTLALLTQMIDYIQTLDMDIVSIDTLTNLINTPPAIVSDGVLMYDFRDLSTIKRNTGNEVDVVFDKLVTPTLGDEENSGTTTPFAIYQITATAENYFYTGCQVGHYYCERSKGRALSASNKVRRYTGNNIGFPTALLAGQTGPVWDNMGLIFPGGSTIAYIKTVSIAALKQPCFLFAVMKQITWVANQYILDGNTQDKGQLTQSGSTPDIKAYSGVLSSANSGLTVDTFAIVRLLFNGANSKLQVNNNAPVTGDFGSYDPLGLTVGACGNSAGSLSSNVCFAHIFEIAESITEAQEKDIYNYLANKHGFAMI